ncbi:ATP-binding protein [Deferribacter thermophilus]|uniref:ATP-binding protein n=1 Tax=Deferribacter thermophilus TaxID=53573 RepID=UPI003C144192
MKKLPIGIQSFKEIRTENYYYVDKTHFVKKLAESGKYFFLSRPRRFGKSLFLDTLKEAFSGNRRLFKGLYLYDNWDWNRKYPIIKISFGSGVVDSSDKLIKLINYYLDKISRDYDTVLNENLISLKFKELIEKLAAKYNEKVVVLVDEYDKPILDRIDDIDVARENREVLKDFYSVLKDADPYLKLVFLTGVSRFSKVSIFSGLNQLNDITLDKRFSTICGYTQLDLENVFADRLKDFNKDEVREWYNGYSWLGESVYNPFDILLLFDKKSFRPYWFETGTPTFLIKMFQRHRYYLPQLEGLEVGEQLLSNLDIDYIYPENLLFQAGYLTIKEFLRIGNENVYVLNYPNLEVKKSFNDAFLTYLTPSPAMKDRAEIGLIRALQANDVSKIKDILYSFFASIPHDWYRKNELEEYEGFYASVIYALFNGAGLYVIAEDTTNLGRIDLTVIWEGRVYVIEFKVVDDGAENKGLNQIKEKRYFEKYQSKYCEIYLIAIEFSREDRNIVSFEWEKLEC